MVLGGLDLGHKELENVACSQAEQLRSGLGAN